MRASVLAIVLVLFFLAACRFGGSGNSATGSDRSAAAGENSYAQKFSLRHEGEFTILTVSSPWQNASATSFEYVLADKDAVLPDSLAGKVIIRTPVERAVIMSTTFITFLDTLGVLNTVRGISGSENIYNQEINNNIEQGNIRDVGFDQALNYEILIELDPDVIFLFGVQAGIVQTIQKLRESGLNAVICADYLEPHPLGRSEWIKFFAAFYEQEALADEIFADIAERYLKLTDIAREEKVRPAVMLGLPWKDAWYVAGGSSFAAKLIEDAGGSYIFSDLENSEAQPFDIESVFSRALESDVWINPGSALSLKNILDHDQRFSMLNPFSTGRIYSNNKRMGPHGGNDYWESGTMNPDLILQDLYSIFHNHTVEDSMLHYYFRLQ